MTDLEDLTTSIQILNLPEWVVKAIIFLFVLRLVGVNVEKLSLNAIHFLKDKIDYLDANKRSYIRSRNNFIEHLLAEINKIDVDTNWSDYYYTKLDAEVEITNINECGKIKSVTNLIKRLIGIERKNEVKKNLIEAILNSKSNSFLVIGEPGSGKTVSLHKLFRILAKNCIKSKNVKASIPIYLNLKYLRLKEEDITADKIHEWVTNQICSGQDRSVNEFVKHNFEKIFGDGHFFFLFDSFDEIPAIMDSDGDNKIIQKYSKAIYLFFNSATKCKGLVCSRPYRAPTGFMGQKIRILPLSNKKIKEALFKYLDQEHELAARLWQKLTQTYNLLDIIKNPFYLGLLTQYVTRHQTLPEKNYDLFDDFVRRRAEDDTDRLKGFNFTPTELLEDASNLAYSMINTKDIGLNVRVDRINELVNSIDESNKWNSKKVDNLIGALVYSKFGQLSDEDDGTSKSFSFAHRRFHEYFCAAHLKKIHNYKPISSYINEDKWREVLVLLCEVLPSDNLEDVFRYSLHSLSAGIKAEVKTEEHKNAIKTIQFLKDSFHSRVEDIPIELRKKCSEFILAQFNSANILDQKKSIEGAILVTDDSTQEIFGIALQSDSEWIKENVIKSCRILDRIPEQIGRSLRRYIHSTYKKTTILKKYPSYDVYLSSHDVLEPYHSYMKLLYYFAIFQISFYVLLTFYGIILFDTKMLVIIFSSILVYFILTIPEYGYKHQKKASSNSEFTNYNIFFTMNMMVGAILLEYTTPVLVTIFSFICVFLFLEIIFLFLVYYYPQNVKELLKYMNKAIKRIPSKIYSKMLYLKTNFKFIFLNITKILFLTFLIIFLFSLWVQCLTVYPTNSINVIFSEHDSLTASLIVLYALFPIILIAYLILRITYRYLILLLRLINDYSKTKKITDNTQIQPSTFSESIVFLNSLKTAYYKQQYIRQLPKWIVFDKNIEVLIDEAEKNTPEVRDELFKIAEYYEKILPQS